MIFFLKMEKRPKKILCYNFSIYWTPKEEVSFPCLIQEEDFFFPFY
jgi:hypothetical protein